MEAILRIDPQRTPKEQERPMSDLVPLAQAHCIPRRGTEHKLPEARIR